MTNASFISAIIFTFTTNDQQIWIPKHWGTENYQPGSIYVQTTLESIECWDKVTGTWKTPRTFGIDTTNLVKRKHSEYIQSHTTAKNILMLGIDPFILTNDYTPNTAKQIWNAYTAQYKDKFLFFSSLFSFI